MDLTSVPKQLISTEGHDEGGHGIHLVKNTINALSSRTKPAVVVAIVGKSRTGKSYLLNKLAGRDVRDNEKRFKVGATIEAQTHGIWIWVVDHPTKPGHDLILLDTEGIGAPGKANTDNDMWIFCLATLLGSTLVLNIKGSIDSSTIDDISFVTQMSNKLKVDSKRKSGEDLEFDAYFPTLVVAVRDFGLQYDGDYLEKCLTLRKGDDEMTLKFNYSRECIRKYFHIRKCFTIDTPGGSKVCQRMADGDDSKVDEDFKSTMEKFKNHILDECPVKKLRNRIPITGRMLSELLKSYVDSIQNKLPPCIEEAVEKMAAVENQILVEEATELFKTEIGTLPPPANSLGAFHFAKKKAEIAALELFRSKAIDDKSGEFHLNLKGQIEVETSKQREIHREASEIKCKGILEEMFQKIEKKMVRGDLKGLDGKRDFEESLNEIHSTFMGRHDLGMKKTEVLIRFLQEKQSNFEEIQMMESFQMITTKVKHSGEEEEKKEKEKQSEIEQELVEKNADVRKGILNRDRPSTAWFTNMQEARQKDAERLKEEGFADIAEKREQGILKTKEINDNRLSVIRRKVDELELGLENLARSGGIYNFDIPSQKDKKGFVWGLWKKIRGK